ncbi:MAG: AraC family transcriptional regulator [Bacteroidota bacterium]
MKTQFETISPDAGSSFRLLRNPQLSEVFLWHFHPEYELVYIEGTHGTRHVGDHISPYSFNDLVLIGSNIPHLNFDYGVKGDYEKVVLQFHPSFKQEFFQKFPELQQIYTLFERSQKGIAFSGQTKTEIGKRLKTFHLLPSFEQFLELLHIFQLLSESEEFELLHETDYVNSYSKKEQQRLRKIYAFVDEYYAEKIEVGQVAELCNLSKAAFCRYFKKANGNTFIEFLNQYRISQAKRLLLSGKRVGEACYDSGFESLSYFNRTFKKIAGENPSKFRDEYVKGISQKV